MKEIDKVLNSIKKIVGNRNLIVSDWAKEPFLKGWRYGEGNALAVVKPEKLIEMWEVLELCVKNDLIIIMQAANTGLTGGSTPDGKNYDREIIIINTINLKDIHVINNGKQIIGFAGSTLYDLEKKIKKYVTIESIDEALNIKTPKMGFPKSLLASFLKDYHKGDINLFWEDIRINSIKRAQSYFKKLNN